MTDPELLSAAERFGTPLYLFDERSLHERTRLLRRALPESVSLCYAVKANPFVIPHLAGLVERLEVCSPGEIEICRACGQGPRPLVVSGVYKDPSSVGALMGRPELPAAFTVESAGQLEMLQGLAGARGRRIPVLIRVSSGNQFGVDARELAGMVARRASCPHLDFRGIQLFSGTQKAGGARMARELAQLDDLLDELKRSYGWRAAELEYGPGLPVAYFENDAVDEGELLATLADAIRGLRTRAHVTLEIGRSLAASCGTYLTRVVDAKCVKGRRFAIVDGGIHHITYFGHSMAMRQPSCRIVGTGGGLGRAPVADGEPWTVCGALCTANDILVKQLDSRALEAGDLIAFERAGAYCATEGISLFLSRDLPAVAARDLTGAFELLRAATPIHPLNTPRVPLA